MMGILKWLSRCATMVAPAKSRFRMSRNLVFSTCFLAIAVIGLTLLQLHPSSPKATETRVSSTSERNVYSSVTTTSETPISPVVSLEAVSNKVFVGTESTQNSPSTEYQGLDKMNDLLVSGRYEQAVQLYSDVYDLLSELETEVYRETILSVADTLILQGDHGTVISLLEEYTSVFIKDIDALRMLANSQHALEDYIGEINTLFLALNEAYEYSDIVEFETKLESAVQAQDLLYIQDKAEGAVDFYRNLAMVRPESVPLRIGLARALISEGAIKEAGAILKSILNSGRHGGEIDRLAQLVRDSQT